MQLLRRASEAERERPFPPIGDAADEISRAPRAYAVLGSSIRPAHRRLPPPWTPVGGMR